MSDEVGHKPSRDDGSELYVYPPRLVEMTPEQHEETIRLLIALIDAGLARRHAARADRSP